MIWIFSANRRSILHTKAQGENNETPSRFSAGFPTIVQGTGLPSLIFSHCRLHEPWTTVLNWDYRAIDQDYRVSDRLLNSFPASKSCPGVLLPEPATTVTPARSHDCAGLPPDQPPSSQYSRAPKASHWYLPQDLLRLNLQNLIFHNLATLEAVMDKQALLNHEII